MLQRRMRSTVTKFEHHFNLFLTLVAFLAKRVAEEGPMCAKLLTICALRCNGEELRATALLGDVSSARAY
jgi:hypothetical protein